MVAERYQGRAQPVTLPTRIPEEPNLYAALIRPIEDLLPKEPTSQIIFVPDGGLVEVPFAALVRSEGRSLIDLHVVRMSPALFFLELARERRGPLETGGEALVVGNPKPLPEVPSCPGLSPLPSAEREAEVVARELGAKPLVREQASMDAVLPRMTEANTLHFATHSCLNPRRGLDSALLFAPSRHSIEIKQGGSTEGFGPGSDEVDGILTAGSISSRSLKAGLVVLSACDTGRGQVVRGDALVGLPWSFAVAGVPSILVSLWPVQDAPTESLMVEFYRSLRRQPDKARALREAMLATRERYPSPRDWAAFTLIGRAR